MHFTADAPAPAQVLAAISAGEELHGQLVSLPALLATLGAAAPPAEGWRVRNAVLIAGPDAITPPAGPEWPSQLVFAHCTFADLTTRTLGEASRPAGRVGPATGPGVCFREWVFRHPLQFYRCSFVCPVAFDACTFGGLAFEDSTAFSALTVDRCTFPRQPPAVRGCEFRGAFRAVYPRDPGPARPPRYWAFDRCEFHGEVRVDQSPGRAVPLKFSDCLFGPMSAATLEVAPTRDRAAVAPPLSEEAVMLLSDLQMRSCSVQGYVTVHAASGGPAGAAPTVWVALNDTTLAGALDLEKSRLSHLSLHGVQIPDGRVKLTPDQLLARDGIRPRTRGETFWGWARRVLDLGLRCDGDEPGVLTAERYLPDRLANAAAEPVHQTVSAKELYGQLAAQYGELRNAFARIASESKEEGRCHYKYKDYSRCADVARLRAERAWPDFRSWALGLLALAVVAGLALGADSPRPLVLSVVPLFVLYRTRARGHPPTIMGVAGAAFDKLVWKHLLGYGMYARRVFTTAGWVIVLCAAAYGAADHWWPETLGKVEGGDTRLTTAKPPTANSSDPPPSPGFFGAVRNCLYYSVVTFTTLGYGDFAPKGPLQLLAAAEALIGGVLIAFLTVVFARKFIR